MGGPGGFLGSQWGCCQLACGPTPIDFSRVNSLSDGFPPGRRTRDLFFSLCYFFFIILFRKWPDRAEWDFKTKPINLFISWLCTCSNISSPKTVPDRLRTFCQTAPQLFFEGKATICCSRSVLSNSSESPAPSTALLGPRLKVIRRLISRIISDPVNKPVI